jgi:hypothetical protein
LTPRAVFLLTAAAVALTAAAVSPEARAQAAPASLHLLDVPYLPQSEALCGGAAAAMVMRYWGASGVYAETFADLVVPAAGGIKGEDLLEALQARGWVARSFRGDAELVQSHLAARRPVIALIEDRPGRFHYVVIVGWSNGRVIAHDPARAPFRVLDADAFLAAWKTSNFWTMLALPDPQRAKPPTVPGDAPRAGVSARPNDASLSAPPDDMPSRTCAAMVDEGIRLAGAGQPADARYLFEVAAQACPASPAPWRELAGVHALLGEWSEAAAEARRALARDPHDAHAWRILATSLYLEGDAEGALAAWNAIGEPVIDLIDVKGLDRTRFAVVSRTMGLRPQTVLTPAALRAARHRLAQLPFAQTARAVYRPAENGQAQVEAIVLERPLFPASPVALAATGLRLLTDRELAVAVSSPTGGGEVWRASWRWWEHRPRVAFDFVAPAPSGGIWGVRAFGDSEAYDLGAGRIDERRRGAAFILSRWTDRSLRWDLAAGFDRWSESRRGLSVSAGAHQRLAQDRAFVEAEASAWTGSLRTWTGAVRGEWRSALPNDGHVFIARGGISSAGRAAPLSLWPGAGTGHARGELLRAHPLLDGGIVIGPAFGRTLSHASAEWRRWMQPLKKPIRIAPAIFVDSARATRRAPASDERWYTDAGIGVRVAIPGAGILRIDAARGLRDGVHAISFGWSR